MPRKNRSDRRSAPTYKTQSPLAIGDSVTAGREKHVFASRKPILLPRANALATSGAQKTHAILADVSRKRSGFRTTPVFTVVSRVPVRRQIKIKTLQLSTLKTLTLKKLQKNPCTDRRDRKQVMFAVGVAGKKWGSGSGPSMQKARRTVNSQYQCR